MVWVLKDANYWHRRAKEVIAVAAGSSDTAVQNAVQKIADEYERNAATADALVSKH